MSHEKINLCSMTPGLTKGLNIIAEQSRQEFTSFVDRLSLGYKDNPYWWATPLACRDTDISDFYLNFCKVKLAARCIRKGYADQAVVPTWAMKRAIERNIDAGSAKVAVRLDKKEAIKGMLHRLYAFYVRLKFRHRVELTKRAAGIPDLSRLNGKTILVDKYMIPSQFKNGEYTDRYFHGLRENTQENVLFLTQSDFNSSREGRILAKNVAQRKECILMEQFARREDYKKVREYSRQCRSFRFHSCKMGGLDITDLIQHEMRKAESNLTSMYGIVKAAASCRLIEEYGLKVKEFISWDEGKPSNNAVYRELRKRYKFPTVAYVTSPCMENHLSKYPSPIQVEEKCVAEYYAVQGREWIAPVRQFEPSVKCIKAPSFRYQYVFGIDIGIPGRRREGIILILPFDVQASAQLMRCFFHAAKGMDGIKAEIKNHPANDSLLLDGYGIKPEECSHIKLSFVSGKLLDAVKGKEMAILCEDTSNLEVILSGIFTVSYIVRGRLGCLCLPPDMDVPVNIAYGPEDIREFILNKEGVKLDKSKLKEIRNGAFTDVNRETVSGFLDLEEIR